MASFSRAPVEGLTAKSEATSKQLAARHHFALGRRKSSNELAEPLSEIRQESVRGCDIKLDLIEAGHFKFTASYRERQPTNPEMSTSGRQPNGAGNS